MAKGRSGGRRKVVGAGGATVKTESYRHPTAELLLRPEIGTQAQFKKKKPPATYRYDSSLSPELNWDGQNPARELGEWLLSQVQAAAALTDTQPPFTFPAAREFKSADGRIVATVGGLADAVEQLKRLGGAFLNWAGKAERLSFDVPTLPLFVHERLSTKAIIETLRGHKRDKQLDFFDLYGNRDYPAHEQVLRAYEHRNGWVNRMVLGDSLVVMNSLLRYEGLGGQVQMIYMDPPYGVKFGSNFQPFIRKRDVKHNEDEDMTREPEMVQAYRDTWELGLHSYLTYMRDRLRLCHDLLHPSGSIFVQISDESLHHVRELMDEVFGAECFIITVAVKKKGSQKSSLMDPVNDYLLWYGKTARVEGRTKFRPYFVKRELDAETISEFKIVELPDGREFPISEMPDPQGEIRDYRLVPKQIFSDYPGAHLFASNPLTSGGERKNQSLPFKFEGKEFSPPKGSCWKTTVRTDDGSVPGMTRLAETNRLLAGEGQLRFKRYLDDFGFIPLSNWWDGLGGASDPIYVVQTNTEIVQRCILMTTDPGDLVLDPTCGSGTTAYVAERWGRRWITADTSRVPLALARQRLLTATFPYYELKDETLGPAGGFVYQRKQNSKGEEIGGIVPHVTLKSIANNEPPGEEVLVDRPEEDKKATRVTGPFCFEATIPTPVDWEGDGVEDSGTRALPEQHGSFIQRMLEVLRRSPVLHLDGGRKVLLRNVRPPAKTLALSAEAMVDVNGHGGASGPLTLEEAVQVAMERDGKALPFTGKPVAIVFGPENGAISEKLVWEAAREAAAKSYAELYVIGFAIQPHARKLVEECEKAIGIPAVYVQATPDLMMGDLLKNMRSSQIFSVCGLPEVAVHKVAPQAQGEVQRYSVELLGLDVFDPTTMQTQERKGDDVPAWFLDTDYNGRCFHVSQAFFPRTGAWGDLKKALKAEFAETVWDHLAGTRSAPFEAGEHEQVAVKVIDDRGNELMVVKALAEAR